MAIRYGEISKKPRVFESLYGMKVSDFKELVKKVRPLFEEREHQKKVSGRPSHLDTLESKLLCVLMYYRTYVSQTFFGIFI